MKIDRLIISAVIAAALALEAWTLREVVSLKVSVAQLSERVATLNPAPVKIAQR